MSENNSDLSLQLRKDDITDTIQSKNDSSQSLLSIVHDKNKKIEKLQRQLHFQKMQLKFYLGKTFSDTKMIGFSKTCHPQSVDDNLPVTLAVNRFNKQSGHKSKIINLYDRMCCIDGRISGLLQVQECFLRKLIGKICEFAKNGTEIDVQLNYRKMLTNPEYMNIFNNLIHANIGLKKSLDTFRICCDRLIVVEEERNLIVDQVYSLPIEQRTNCNYLIGIQIEKVQLQNRMKDILKDQVILRGRIEELSSAEEHLKKLQEEYKEAFKTSTENVTDMLRKINTEAIGLVDKSNLQREKYTKEIVKLKSENSKISRILERLKVSISDKVMSRDSIKLDSIYSAGLFQALDKEIAQAIKDNEMNKNSTMLKVKSDCKELSQNLRTAQNQNILLSRELDSLKTEYEEAKRKWTNERETLKKERDDYRSQVEDLQAIRTAYAQLVESRADMKANEDKMKKAEKRSEMLKLSEIEQENLKLSLEVKDLKEEVNKQKAKNVRMSALILNLKGNDQKTLAALQTETKGIGSGDVANNGSKPNSPTDRNPRRQEGDTGRSTVIEELQKSKLASQELIQILDIQQLDDITSKILQGLSSTDSPYESTLYTVLNSLTDDPLLNAPSQEVTPSKVKHIPQEGFKDDAVGTTFEIQSSHRDGKTDTIKGFLEGRRKVEGTLKMGDTSMLSVKVKCLTPTSSIYESSKTNQMILYKTVNEMSNSPPVTKVQQVSEVKQSVTNSLEDEVVVSTKKEEHSKSIQVRYRNSAECRMTDSESQCSDLDTLADEKENNQKEKSKRNQTTPVYKHQSEQVEVTK